MDNQERTKENEMNRKVNARIKTEKRQLDKKHQPTTPAQKIKEKNTHTHTNGCLEMTRLSKKKKISLT